MENIHIGVIVIVVMAALALVIFIIARNRRDRKELFPPEATEDTTEKEKMDQQREEPRL